MRGPHEVIRVTPAVLKTGRKAARTHSKKQVEQICKLIIRYGWTYPIVVDEHYQIIAGYGRLLAARKLGIGEVPIIVISGLCEAEKQALALADNKVATNAGWDREVLAEMFVFLEEELPKIDLDLEFTGFETAEVEQILEDFGGGETDPADEVGEVGKIAVTQAGDLWLLGKHRLLCGDAKSDDDIARLMAGKTAAMALIDPPYNVRVASIQGRGKIKHAEFHEASGEMSPRQFRRFLQSVLRRIAKSAKAGAIVFVCMDWRHVSTLIDAGEEIFGELKQLVVWVKTNAGQGSFYRSQHELICVFKNGEGQHTNTFGLGQHGRNRSNVWEYAGVNTFRKGRMDELTVHPTVKPVALVADAIRDCSKRGDIILDTFMGSGTTLLAAERVGRQAFGTEIESFYVDVAIRRWQQFTGRDAILESTGETFEEVATARLSALSPSVKMTKRDPDKRSLPRVRIIEPDPEEVASATEEVAAARLSTISRRAK